jgi:sugar/nucleoside kinase (ribokinase family)
MLENGRLHDQPAAPARVVDTLGAGDAMIAGVIGALLRGSTPDSALRRAASAAAAACTHVGAWGPD